jgi:hypothetical protein
VSGENIFGCGKERANADQRAKARPVPGNAALHLDLTDHIGKTI